MATESFFSSASLAYLASAGAGKDGKTYSIKPTDGTGDFTFSRGSNLAATRVGADGLIEKGRENLLTYSNDFSQWTQLNTTPTSGQSGYDGTNDATEISFTAGSTRAIGKGGLQTSVVNFSVYVKAGTHDFIQFTPSNSATTFANFEISASNPATGNTGGLVIDSSIEDVGNGWYRCSAVINNSGSGTMWIWIVDSLTSGRAASVSTDGTFFLQDAQLEIGLAATDYIESGATTGKAGLLEDEPRFDYSGGATCPSLLLEPSRTNLVQSEYLDGIAWSGKIGVSFDTNTTTSPEGLENSALLKEDSSNGSHFAYKDFSLTSGSTYTISIFAKSNGTNRNLRFGDGGLGWSSGFNGVFDLTAGTATGGTIEPMGSGWYRCSVTGTTNATSSRLIVYSTLGVATSYQGDGSSGVYLYGFQLEQGSYPTSYIPNHSGGSVTRGADECSVTGASSLIGQTEGTFYVDFEYLDGQYGANENWFALESDAGGDRVLFYKGATTNQRILIQANASNVYANSSLFALSAGTRYKLAVRYNSGDIAVYLNGSQLVTDTSTYTRTANLNNVTFNESSQAPSSRFNQMLVFTEGLSNADLATLTTI